MTKNKDDKYDKILEILTELENSIKTPITDKTIEEHLSKGGLDNRTEELLEIMNQPIDKQGKENA